MLEELISDSFTSPNRHIPFKGITHSLYSVELVRVAIPKNIIFLRNLKELRLQSILYRNKRCPLSRYCDILDACPDLEKLELDAHFIKHPLDQRPVLLAKLSSFGIRGEPWETDNLETILDMITAPSLGLLPTVPL
ncbi:hypothetical protein FS837_006324 [Tulasnella sp. UAMH 9824]|nr:hypothetical protein FS837_006324 [Tulasnella sp. UAMH 9824]